MQKSFDLKKYENRLASFKTQLAEGVDHLALKNLVRDLHKAIDTHDRGGEEKANEKIKKMMIASAKEVYSAFASDFKHFLKAKEKEYSTKYGVEVHFFDDGKPILGMGTNASPLAVKGLFGAHLIVEPPDLDLRSV